MRNANAERKKVRKVECGISPSQRLNKQQNQEEEEQQEPTSTPGVFLNFGDVSQLDRFLGVQGVGDCVEAVVGSQVALFFFRAEAGALYGVEEAKQDK